MQNTKLSFSQTHSFSSFFLDYINQHNALQKFYNRFPVLENFKEQISEKEKFFPESSRLVLAEVLTSQYQELETSEVVSSNINLLKDKKTFTITTGHQLNIFTGPLYFIYKIVTVINTCKELGKAYPDYNFVPVYWMASEDHDYDEIKYFRLYGKKYTWETNQQGAVGHFDPKGIATILDQLPGNIDVFKKAYLNHGALSDAVRCYVNDIFGSEGLVVIDADNRDLKKLLIPVIENDLFQHSPQKLVDETSIDLNDLGYKTQVNAREINFFYLEKGLRSRIEKEGDTYHVVDTEIKFSKKELQQIIKTEPEKFSPNVILRPLYQEIILPNLAYIGGPAEIVYWLQLKSVFEHFSTPFPMLMPRNFALLVKPEVQRKVEKTGLSIENFFEDQNTVQKNWVLKFSENSLTTSEEQRIVSELFAQLQKRATKIDSTLAKFLAAETKRAQTSLEKIEKKMIRAEKRLHEDRFRQIEAVKNALFPNGSLQERTDNFLNFYQEDSQFIEKLLKSFDPLDFKFNVLIHA